MGSDHHWVSDAFQVGGGLISQSGVVGEGERQGRACTINIRMASNVTQILSAIDSGDPRAAAQLLPLVYQELRKLADARLAQEQPGQTLQATALVHEAYLRLVGPGQDGGSDWDNRGHFFAAAAEA